MKALLEGKIVELGNVSYKLSHAEDSFQLMFYTAETDKWLNTNMDFQFLTKLCGHLTEEEVLEINIKDL